MPIRTTGRTDGEILLADGATWLPFMLARPRGQDGQTAEGVEPSIQEVLAASDNDLPTSKRLQAEVQETWHGGIGPSYHSAECVYTRTEGFAVPAGAGTAATTSLSAIGTSSNSQIVAIKQFGTSLYAAQTGNGSANTGRVLRSADGGATWTVSLALGASEYARDLLVYDNGSGVDYLYVSVSNVEDPNPGTIGGYFYRCSGADVWSARSTQATASAGHAASRQRMRKVFWTDQQGIGDWRMAVISGAKSISYTRPGADPFTNTPTQWIEGVRIRTGWNLLRMAAARRHIWVSANDGIYDLNEQGDTPNLLGYNDTLLHGANGQALHYKSGYVYGSLGQGLHRAYVGDGPALTEDIEHCSPGWGTQARSEWGAAWTTELLEDQGWLVDAVYNPVTQKAGIFWGRERKSGDPESGNNPLLWFGPEVVLTGGYKITAMALFSPANDDLRLLISGWGGGVPVIGWVSLPLAGSPIDNLLSNSKHKFATGTPVTFGSGTLQPASRLHLLDEGFGDRTSKKIVYQHTLNTEGLSGSTLLTLEERADAATASISWTTSTNVTTSPVQTVTPSSVTSGQRIERRISFVSPSGGATPPVIGVLDACRITAWRVVPSVGVRIIDIEYGDGVTDLHGVEERDFAPDDITTLLLSLIDAGGRTTVRWRDDKKSTVRVEQVLDRDEQLGEGKYGKSVKARLEINILAAA